MFVLALILLFPAIVFAQGNFTPSTLPHSFCYRPAERSLLETGFGYSMGFNEILFRNGDNVNFAPVRKQVGLDSFAFSVQGETFVSPDLALRIQGWINVPQEIRSNFFLGQDSQSPSGGHHISRSWDTKARYIEGDLAATYFFGLYGMPYAAGLTAGYRYNDLDYRSLQVSAPGYFHDHFQVHIPYFGVYYVHAGLLGSLVRLDLLTSPFTMSRLDSNLLFQFNSSSPERLPTEITGYSLLGFWFESVLDCAVPVGRGAFVGAFAKYDYLELSGWAKFEDRDKATNFAMDSRKHLFVGGVNVSYRF